MNCPDCGKDMTLPVRLFGSEAVAFHQAVHQREKERTAFDDMLAALQKAMRCMFNHMVQAGLSEDEAKAEPFWIECQAAISRAKAAQTPNAERAQRGMRAIENTPDYLENGIECALTDLLTNLRHACKLEGFSFQNSLDLSLQHFEAECEEEAAA